MTRIILSGMLLLASTSALAQIGFMRNISASGVVIDDPQSDLVVAQIACTVVSDGSTGLIIFAEANDPNTDPLVVLQDLATQQEFSNDDWVDLPAADRNFISSALRSPNQSIDSALVGEFIPGSYCAYAFQNNPNQPAGFISLQITDVSEDFFAKHGATLPKLEPMDDPAIDALLEKARQGLPRLLR